MPGPEVCLDEGARESERDRDTRRVVERRVEPAVVMAAHDERRAPAAPRQEPDDVGGSARTEAGVDDHADRLSLVPLETRRVFLAHDREGRCLPVPHRVECPERALCLEPRAARAAEHDDRRRAAEAELEPEVVGPQLLVAPVDEHDLAGHVDGGQLPAPASTNADELPRDAPGRGPGHPSHRDRVVARSARLDPSSAEPPGVDRHRLLDDIRQPQVSQLPRDEGRGAALLRRARDPESERARADRRKTLDDVAQVLGRDALLDGGEHRRDLRGDPSR